MTNVMIPICRVCLKTSLEYIDLETPFDVEQVERLVKTSGVAAENLDEFTYMDCLKEVTRLEVETDGHNSPHSLCVACGLELRITYEFLKKAEGSAIILREAVERTKLEPNIPVSNLVKNDLLKFASYDADTEALDESSCVPIGENKTSDPYSNTDNVPYECDFCDKTFYSQDVVDLHISEIHCSALDDLEYTPLVSDDGECDHYENNDSDIELTFSNGQLAEENSDGTHLKKNKIKIKLDDQKVNKNMNEQILKESVHENDELILYCGSCGDFFNSEHLLQVHYQTEHQNQKTLINKVHQLYEISGERNQKVNLNIVQCLQCDFKGRELQVRQHKLQVHAQEYNFLCNICSKTFSTYGILNAHLKYHQRKEANFKSDACRTCGKQFSTKHYLRLHMDVHKNNRKLHKCNQCDKIYVTKNTLDNHMKLHKGETLQCLACNKQFSRQYELNVHMRFHTGEYPFACELCGKKFAIKGHLRTHMWRHQGLKLKCENCGKLFTSSKALQEHSFTHSEMPYPCSYCSKAYPSKQKFKVHLKTVHSVELNVDELRKIRQINARKPLLRKKLTLVLADVAMKKVEMKTKDDNN